MGMTASRLAPRRNSISAALNSTGIGHSGMLSAEVLKAPRGRLAAFKLTRRAQLHSSLSSRDTQIPAHR